MSELIIVSSCLAGINCRYDGGNNKVDEICEMVSQGKALPLCPEVLGNLETPRDCCEIVFDKDGNKKVISNKGCDVTKAFEERARKTLEIAKITGVKKAILQARSPSCGYGKIYDGTFKGKLINGNGLTAELLSENGIKVYTPENFDTGY